MPGLEHNESKTCGCQSPIKVVGYSDASDGQTSATERTMTWSDWWSDRYGVQHRVGGSKVKVKDMIRGSCGCFDIGAANFKLLTSNIRSKFAAK